jgi:hypothetical protein
MRVVYWDNGVISTIFGNNFFLKNNFGFGKNGTT